MQIAILGRQPKISLAELESLFGSEAITPVSDYAAIVKSDDPLPQPRLGGTIKSARLLTRLQNTDLIGAFGYLKESASEHLQYLPEGKLQLGVSVYGFTAKRDWLLKQTLSLKKVIKGTGRSVRIIENKAEALETALVLYNKLTGPLGWELLLIKDNEDVILAQTTAVQDIDAYARRDFERPKRDAYVGMLPPKLAQIMINLATGKDYQQSPLPSLEHFKADSSLKTYRPVVLDPFCGTGVVLQEALLMGYDLYGTDVEPRMIEYTKTNLDWLAGGPGHSWELEVADATNTSWRGFEFVVCETYLGAPLTSLPQQQKFNEIVQKANEIASGFLKNLATQLKKGSRLCIALPAWHLGSGKFKHLPVLDQLADMGYNRLDLVHAKHLELIYHRPEQIVARELTILEKK